MNTFKQKKTYIRLIRLLKNIPCITLYTSYISDITWNLHAFENSWYES